MSEKLNVKLVHSHTHEVKGKEKRGVSGNNATTQEEKKRIKY